MKPGKVAARFLVDARLADCNEVASILFDYEAYAMIE
jgi:hypothetical protein